MSARAGRASASGSRSKTTVPACPPRRNGGSTSRSSRPRPTGRAPVSVCPYRSGSYDRWAASCRCRPGQAGRRCPSFSTRRPLRADRSPTYVGTERGIRSVLVVDDDVAVGRAVARMLRTVVDVELASGVAQALEMLVDREFDLVLSDLQMPAGGRPSALRRARRSVARRRAADGVHQRRLAEPGGRLVHQPGAGPAPDQAARSRRARARRAHRPA